jgi:ATP-dependent RNA helicase RhlE
MTQHTPALAPANTFAQLGLAEPLLRALTEKKYTHPSPIQAEAIPHLLAGRDLMGSAQTGTGKTAAFALPILQRLSASLLPRVPRSPRALILTPTRELAVQIGASFTAYGKYLKMRHVVIYGGVGQQPQVSALHHGCDIAIATPGRLLDLAQQGHVRFDHVEIFVLDEADRMLDMGFAPDVKRILAKLPEERQSLLFSATMPSSILDLAARILDHPVRVEMTPEAPTVDRVTQRVYMVNQGDKYPLIRQILGEHADGLVLAFTRTKHGAKKLARNLTRDGFPAGEIHGNKSQSARQNALETFRSGRVRVLVATDVAARGIDVKGIALVINYDIPNEPEAYVHRIGRTARAGAEGLALSFCDHSERNYLRGIQRLIRQNIPVHQANSAPRAETSEAPAHRPERRPEPRSEHRTEHRSEHRSAPRSEHRSDRGVDSSHRPEHRQERRPETSHRPAHALAPEHSPAPERSHSPADSHRPAARVTHAPERTHAPARSHHAAPTHTHRSVPSHASHESHASHNSHSSPDSHPSHNTPPPPHAPSHTRAHTPSHSRPHAPPHARLHASVGTPARNTPAARGDRPPARPGTRSYFQQRRGSYRPAWGG